MKLQRALISVYDKTGVVEFARALHDEFGAEVVSTGGTARALHDAGVSVTLVEEVTGAPEMLGGRVKTLHPHVHGAILADRGKPEHARQLQQQGITPIDLVAVNLYPFQETIAKPGATDDAAIEMIDIGGPCLLRAAAKNHAHVLPVVDPEDYQFVLAALRGEELELSQTGGLELRRRLALKAFRHTSMYDLHVALWLEGKLDARVAAPPAGDDEFSLQIWRWADLRYGENPHQQASVYKFTHNRDAFDLTNVRTGDEATAALSYNNLTDATAALDLCADLTRTHQQPHAACFIKHTNPCGAAWGTDPIETYRKAYLGDPLAAMGGILATNFTVDAIIAEAVMDSLDLWGRPAGAGAFFIEVWVAPEFDADAQRIIRQRRQWGPRVRLVHVGDLGVDASAQSRDVRNIPGGLLVQTTDSGLLNEPDWQAPTKRQPTVHELADLRLAWLVAKHTKSNAISICRDGMLIGNGAGQMSRVMSCRLATWLAHEARHDLSGSVAASDGFFPFRDGPDVLADAGVRAVIQPGGSKRDPEVIQAADERDLAMLLTNQRHFRH